MKVADGFCIFSDVEIAAGRHVNIPVNMELLLMESLLKEKLDCTIGVLLVQAILLGGHHNCINRLQEVCMNNLLPGASVLANEAILNSVKE